MDKQKIIESLDKIINVKIDTLWNDTIFAYALKYIITNMNENKEEV